MNAKTTKVVLIAGILKQEFTFEEAEFLLNMKDNGGWHLPPNSNYEFVDNAIISRGTKQAATGKQKKRNA